MSVCDKGRVSWVALCPPERYAEVPAPLLPEAVEVTSFGQRVFADVIKLRRGHIGLGRALIPVTGILIRKANFGHSDTGAETGLVQLWTKELQKSADTARSREEARKFLPESRKERGSPAPTLRLPNWGRTRFCSSKHPGCRPSFQQPKEINSGCIGSRLFVFVSKFRSL